MSKEILINKETFTCTKKKMKSALKNKGFELSLSEVANLLAQSFGYKNEFEMQNSYFREITRNTDNRESNCFSTEDHSSILQSIYTEKTPEGYIRHKNPKEIKDTLCDNNIYTIKSYKEYNILCLDVEIKRFNVSQQYNGLLNNIFYNVVKDINDNYLPQKISGNILISGTSASGKTSLANKLTSFRKNMVSLEKFKENIYAEEEMRVFNDFLIFFSNKNIIASIHSSSCIDAIQNVKQLRSLNDVERIKFNERNILSPDEIENKISCVINIKRI